MMKRWMAVVLNDKSCGGNKFGKVKKESVKKKMSQKGSKV